MAKNKSKNKTGAGNRTNTSTPEKQAHHHSGTRASMSSGSSTGTSTPVSRNLNGGKDDQSQSISFEKRDSAISTTWEDSKHCTGPQPAIGPRLEYAPVYGRWRSNFRLHHWYPCRLLRCIRDYIVGYLVGFAIAFARAYRGSRGKDILMTLCALVACLVTCYTTLQLLLVLVRGASAQELGQNTSCSVAYVTMPGPATPDPIITVSFIDDTSSDSVRETSYYSVISESAGGSTNVLTPNVPNMSPPASSGITPATSPSDVETENAQRSSVMFDMTGLNLSMPHATQNNEFAVELPDFTTISFESTSPTPMTVIRRSGLETAMSSGASASTFDFTASSILSPLSTVRPLADGVLPSFYLASTFSILAPNAANRTLSLLSSQSTRASLTSLVASRPTMTEPSGRLIASPVTLSIDPILTGGPLNPLPLSRQSKRRSNLMSNTWSSGTWTGTTTLPSGTTPITSAIATVNPSGSIVDTRPVPSGISKRIVAHEDTSFVFVFPRPSITTTVSYWTGVYPSVTGPEAWDLHSIPLTTRAVRQSPLSQLPLFEMFTSTRSRFKTIVSTVTRSGESPKETSMVVPEEPVLCGESGNFTLTFDDTVVGPKEAKVIVANGMKNPYHHMFYANGYTNVPDKWEPYRAVSQPNVAMFLPLRGRLLANAPFAGTLLPGEIGAGPRASVSAYWFNAYSGFFGCALSGLTPCQLRVSGFRYDAVLKQEVVAAEQNVTIPACYGYINCRLTQVIFNDDFRALSGIQFNAYTSVLGVPQVHMMDDVKLEWYNSSCAAGIMRIGHW